MKVICGWCGKDLGTKPGPAEEISHGMCEACHSKLNAQLDAVGKK